MTRRFHKTKFRGFFSERELVDFLHMLWRHFCQISLRTWKRILFHTYRNKLTKLISCYCWGKFHHTLCLPTNAVHSVGVMKLCLRQFSIPPLYTQTGPETSSKPRPLLAWSRKMVGKLMQLVNTVYVLWCT